jgi:hypothetical protein
MTRTNGATHRQKALVVAPFFSAELAPNRPMMVACALAEFMDVDVVTTDFNHASKLKRQPVQAPALRTISYLPTAAYHSNVGLKRFLSHAGFCLRATEFVRRCRNDYDLFYVTAPFNALAVAVMRLSREKPKILDVIDIWPDVLPFPGWVRTAFTPLFAAWKALFSAAARNADLVLTVSDSFLQEALISGAKKGRRFYIGHHALPAAGSKESRFTVAYVGNIGRLYDFETLLDVASDQELSDCIQLFVIGEGERRNWFLSELERRSIPHQYFGSVYEKTELAAILSRCHVGFNGYVNTTAAFSYKANTYFAAGLPILNSMGGDLRDLVQRRKLGLNYHQSSRDELRAALTHMMVNGTALMEENVRCFFDSELDSAKLAIAVQRCIAEEFGISKTLSAAGCESHNKEAFRFNSVPPSADTFG